MRVLTKTLISASLLSLSIPAMADSPWFVRLCAIGVLPSTSSSTISLIGGEVTQISNQVVPKLDFSYFLTPQIAVELILATARHSVEATNTALGSVDLSKVNVLPQHLQHNIVWILTLILNLILAQVLTIPIFSEYLSSSPLHVIFL